MNKKAEEKELTQARIEGLGEAIRDARAAQGLSQTKLGLMIGSGQSYVYRLENGRLAVGIDRLILIADALGLKVSDLIDF